LLRNPGVILAHAIASLVDSRGAIRVPALRPPPIPENVSRALEGLRFGTDPGDPAVDEHWGEPGLSPAQRVIAWNTLEVLAYRTGNPDHPVNAIPPEAKAHMHMRYVVGTDIARLREHVLAHLREHGFGDVQVSQPDVMAATRLDPDNEWVRFAMRSIERTTGQAPVLLPNLGGSLPNDVFADVLGLPTVWIPHSYAGCQQHAPNEHLLLPTVREGLQIMAGLFWDLGEHAQQLRRPLAA
jgi:acetylornithine deacetylase/succinyl-diaminopimelate desuccinylase-like protein